VKIKRRASKKEEGEGERSTANRGGGVGGNKGGKGSGGEKK